MSGIIAIEESTSPGGIGDACEEELAPPEPASPLPTVESVAERPRKVSTTTTTTWTGARTYATSPAVVTRVLPAAVSHPTVMTTYTTSLGATETVFPRVVSHVTNTPMIASPGLGIYGAQVVPSVSFPREQVDFKFYGPQDGHPNPDDHSGYGGPTASLDMTRPPEFLEEANHYEAMAAKHENQVKALESAPLTATNLERQIHELLEGQRSLRLELDQIKQQVVSNNNELETIRQGQGHFMGQLEAPPQYYQQRDLPLGGYSQAPRSPEPDDDGPPMPPRNLGYHKNMEALSSMSGTMSGHAETLRSHVSSRGAQLAASGTGQQPFGRCMS